MAENKVLRRRGRPNETSYREAVSKIIRDIQGDQTDEQLADRLGVSAATISNARNRKGNLCGVTLARIGDEFGPEALSHFASLFGGVCSPIESQAANDLRVISDLNEVGAIWLRLVMDGIRCQADAKKLAPNLRPLVAYMQGVIEQAEAA